MTNTEVGQLQRLFITVVKTIWKHSQIEDILHHVSFNPLSNPHDQHRTAAPHPCLLCTSRFVNKSVDEINRLGNTSNYERKPESYEVGASGEYIDTKKLYAAVSPDNGQSSTSMIILSNLNLLECLIALRHSCHSSRRIGIWQCLSVHETKTRQANKVYPKQNSRMHLWRSMGYHGRLRQWKDNTSIRAVSPPRHKSHEYWWWRAHQWKGVQQESSKGHVRLRDARRSCPRRAYLLGNPHVSIKEHFNSFTHEVLCSIF